jgi:hypothetical protein
MKRSTFKKKPEEKQRDDSDMSFDFNDNRTESVNTLMSKGTLFPNSLDFLDGDVTITDKFGVIRGTFVQN